MVMTMAQKKPKILIVDDRVENLYALDKLLKKLDVETVQALSGAEALNLTLDEDGLRFLQTEPFQCSSLTLDRFNQQPGRPVLWRLLLMQCMGEYHVTIVLDPISGEILPTPEGWGWDASPRDSPEVMASLRPGC